MIQTILIVEDDKSICHFVGQALEYNGYEVVIAETARQAKAIFLSQPPVLVLLDLGLPDEDGMTLLETMKTLHPEIPVIVVSARIWEEEKVKALDMGADDYVVKPFGMSELMARVRTAIRHAYETGSGGHLRDADIFTCDGLVLDVPHHRVTLDGEEIHFTAHEFQILEQLMRNKGKVLTYAWLIRKIWGTYISTDNQILRVNMANIRKKLKENPASPRFIQTELGVGYRMIDEG